MRSRSTTAHLNAVDTWQPPRKPTSTPSSAASRAHWHEDMCHCVHYSSLAPSSNMASRQSAAPRSSRTLCIACQPSSSVLPPRLHGGRVGVAADLDWQRELGPEHGQRAQLAGNT